MRSIRTLPLVTAGSIEFRVGDMLDPTLGEFDHVVAMDSLIHYRPADSVPVIASLAARTRHSLLLTYAPRTPALTVMHAVGRLLPRGNRAPAIEPVASRTLVNLIHRHPALGAWQPARSERIASGFYKSQALELVRR